MSTSANAPKGVEEPDWPDGVGVRHLLLTVEEASHLLGMNARFVYRAIERGEIPVLRFGRLIRIPRARLLTLVGVDPGPYVEAEGDYGASL